MVYAHEFDLKDGRNVVLRIYENISYPNWSRRGIILYDVLIDGKIISEANFSFMGPEDFSCPADETRALLQLERIVIDRYAPSAVIAD
ncbi:hypothetical protein HYT23_02710 [Candidatus Pacearchaeota archaeon]|nr:hypothetical protein [Candidatus Pacearchaeota archaeon]